MFAARHAFCLAILLMACALAPCVQSAESFGSVYISEFLADNQYDSKDDDGDLSPWIELHNGGVTTVNLKGWALTDSPTNLTKWRFPSVGLLPDKYMVVFASGKDRTNKLTHLHTNFRLTASGGYLALVGRETNIVSEFAPAYPTQMVGVAYGRVRGEPAVRGYFPRTTPGKPNSIRGKGFAPSVSFSRFTGTFTNTFSLHLSTRSLRAVIRYTLNGRLPTSRSPVYAGPLLITNTMQVRARSFQEGLLPGPPRSEAFVFLETNVLVFTSSLPVLVIETFGRELPGNARSSFAHFSFFEPLKGKTSLTDRPALVTRGGFHFRGSTSAGMPQPGFAVEFFDEFNEERPRSPLGLPEDSDWILYAPNAYDPVMIHNPFVHQLSRDMGRYSPRTRFVEVYFARSPGPVSAAHYHGLYVLEEKIKISKDRVNIHHLGPEDLAPPEVTGGYVLKFDRLGSGEGGFSAGGASMVYVEPKEGVITLPQRAPQKDYLQSFFDDFDRALNGPKWKDPAAGYQAFLDVDAAIDFHVLEVLSGNVDAMVLSTYFQKPRNGKIICGPHWDFDRALGSTDGRDDNPRQWNTGPFFGGAWWPKLFSDPDFWQKWADRWQELRQTHFSLTNMNRLIDDLAGQVREAQPREYQRWNFQPRGGSYQSELDLMMAWLSNRVEFIDSQLVQPPILGYASFTNAPKNLLTMVASTNSSIYYTLDGSDPRLPQGAVSTNAILYTSPILLGKTAQLIARARNPNQHQTGGPQSSTPWSGPVSSKSLRK